MAKLKQEVIVRGTIPFRANFTWMHSRKAEDIASMQKVIDAGDKIDADDGVFDNDIDINARVRVLFFDESLASRIWIKSEEGDET